VCVCVRACVCSHTHTAANLHYNVARVRPGNLDVAVDAHDVRVFEGLHDADLLLHLLGHTRAFHLRHTHNGQKSPIHEAKEAIFISQYT